MSVLPDPILPEQPIDIRLVAADLDGTLLDAAGALPDELAGVLHRLRERGIVFAPASGRPYASLLHTFASVADEIDAYIADNGTYVVHHGVDVITSYVDPDTATAVVLGVRELIAGGRVDAGLVASSKEFTYTERTDRRFFDAAQHYFVNLTATDDLLAHTAEAFKLSIYVFGDPHEVADAMTELCPDAQVVVATSHWVDVMNTGVNKGVALARLQEALGVTPAQTVAFGDYLNDLEMLAQAEHSFAMANSHPDVFDTAAYIAPSNVAMGVVATLNHLLDL